MNADAVSLAGLLEKVKARPDISRAGMILCHNGIVRETDRSGSKRVRSLKVKSDRAAVARVKTWAEAQPGIVAVEIEPLDGEFHVGDDLLYIVIAGDIRERVIAVMKETLDRVKAEGVQKTEVYDE
jgi:molybdopterin synthase catalytic subunit